MASSTLPARANVSLPWNPRSTPSLSCSTAYTGAQGLTDDSFSPSVNLGRDNSNNVQLQLPSNAVTTTRQAFGARFMSAVSNAQPTAAALSRKGSVLHARAKSLAHLMPTLNPSATSSSERVEAYPRRQPNRILADMFTGESAPIRLGIGPSTPLKEEEEDEDDSFMEEYKPTFTERPSPRRRCTSQSIATNGSNRQGWFKRKSIVATPPPAAAHMQDEMLAININHSLFPNGPADGYSPHAFNDLLLNATTLLERMQSAYKEKVDYVNSVQPEIDAQREEVEEAETRARHLKMQLEDISRRATEQEETMREMASQLAEAKLDAQESRDKLHGTLKLVRDTNPDEADHVPPRRRKCGSAGSTSDSGFESELEYAESVNSSNFETWPSASLLAPTLGHHSVEAWRLNTDPARDRAALSRQSTVSKRSEACLGSTRQAQSDGLGAAWAQIDVLRAENQGLRSQMESLQQSLQGCIDFVGSVTAA